MNSLIELLLLIRTGNHTLNTEDGTDGLKNFQMRVLTIKEAFSRKYIEEPEYRINRKYGMLQIFDQVSNLKLTILGNSYLDK